MQKTVPDLLKFYMKPTMDGASPELEKSTWKIDMANAMTLAISNLFDMVQFSWSGQVVGPGTTSYPMVGVGGEVLTSHIYFYRCSSGMHRYDFSNCIIYFNWR